MRREKLILLSGLDGTGELFEPFIEALSPEIVCETIAYPPNEKLSYDELVAFILERLPKDEPFVLLAESFSGYIAYQVALQKPKHLENLIFVATFLENPRPLFSKLLPIIPMKTLLSLPMPTLVAKYLLLGKNREMINQLQKILKDIPSKTLYHRLLEIVKLPKVSKTLAVKSLYIQASSDKLVPKRVYEVFEKNIANIELVEVKGSHLILQEKPLVCAEIVKEFIKIDS